MKLALLQGAGQWNEKEQELRNQDAQRESLAPPLTLTVFHFCTLRVQTPLELGEAEGVYPLKERIKHVTKIWIV